MSEFSPGDLYNALTNALRDSGFTDRSGTSSPSSKKGKEGIGSARAELEKLTHKIKLSRLQMKEGIISTDEFIGETDNAAHALKGIAKSGNKVQRQQANEAIATVETTKARKAAGQKFSGDIVKFGKELSDVAFAGFANVLGDIQSNASAATIALSTLTAEINVAKVGATALGNTAQTVGMALGGKKGGALALLGSALNFVSDQSTKLATAGLGILHKEVEVATSSFQSLSSAGAMFAGGMTEQTNMAFNAGLSLQHFSAIAKNNAELLTASGLGIAGGLNVLSKTFSGRAGTELKTHLFKLGYTFEEQGELVAQIMSDMRRSGKDLTSVNTTDIQSATEKYAKNLKLIANLTGADAKSKMEAARNRMANIAMEAMLSTKSIKDRSRYQAVIATVNSKLQDAFIQKQIMGTVVDSNVNILMAQVPGIAKELSKISSIADDTTLSTSQSIAAVAASNARIADLLKTQSSALQPLGVAQVSNVAGSAAGAALFMQELLLEQAKAAKHDAIPSIVSATNKQMNTKDPTLSKLASAAVKAEQLTVTVQHKLNDSVSKFAGLINEINEMHIDQTMDAVNAGLLGLVKVLDAIHQPESSVASGLVGAVQKSIDWFSNLDIASKLLVGTAAASATKYAVGAAWTKTAMSMEKAAVATEASAAGAAETKLASSNIAKQTASVVAKWSKSAFNIGKSAVAELTPVIANYGKIAISSIARAGVAVATAAATPVGIGVAAAAATGSVVGLGLNKYVLSDNDKDAIGGTIASMIGFEIESSPALDAYNQKVIADSLSWQKARKKQKANDPNINQVAEKDINRPQLPNPTAEEFNVTDKITAKMSAIGAQSDSTNFKTASSAASMLIIQEHQTKLIEHQTATYSQILSVLEDSKKVLKQINLAVA